MQKTHNKIFILLLVIFALFSFLYAGCGKKTKETNKPKEITDKKNANKAGGKAVRTGSKEKPNGSIQLREVTVYFVKDEKLFAVKRAVDAEKQIIDASIEELLTGPTKQEEEADIFSAIPKGTKLLSVGSSTFNIAVNLSKEYESGGGNLSMFLRLAQVIYTATEQSKNKKVIFLLNGKLVDIFSGEGIVLDKPVGRNDYKEYSP